MKNRWIFISALLVFCLLALPAGLGQAQEPPPEGEVQPEGEVGIAAVGAYIPIQGRLTDASGNPLNGTFNNVSLRIYTTGTGGSSLCQVTPSNLQVSNGLFSTSIPCSSSVVNGQQLYLGVQVGTDAEMTDRQPIYPVPYAFSLKPGASIRDSSSNTLLNVQNNGSGTGIYGYSASGEGVYGWGEAGHGVYGHSYSGYGVYGDSTTGVSLMATGTGIIKSTAATDWNVSPLNIVPGDYGDESDLKIIYSSDLGYVKLYTTGDDYLRPVLPVDVVAYLFGTRVKLSSFHFCYMMDNTAEKIEQVDVEYTNTNGTTQSLCSFTTDVSSTTWTCQTCTSASPTGIYGPVFVRFHLYFAADGDTRAIRLGHMYVHLVE